LSEIAVSGHGKCPTITFQPSSWRDGALARESIQAGVWLEERSFHQQKTAPANTACHSSTSKAEQQRLGSRVKTQSELNNLGFDPIQRHRFSVSHTVLCLVVCWGGHPASYSYILPFGVTE